MTFADLRGKLWALLQEHWPMLVMFVAGWVVGKGWLGKLL